MGNEGLGGIARRWLKSTVEELTTTDNRARERAGGEQERAEKDFKDAAVGEAILSAVPGLRDLRDRQERSAAEAEARRESERVAEIAARPLAGVGLQVAGAVEGSWSGQLPALVERTAPHAVDAEELEYDPWAGEARLRVDLAAPTSGAPVVGGAPLLGWQLVVPGYQGPGAYDLRAIAAERAERGVELDPFDQCLALGHEDEAYYWYADVPGTIEVGDDERALVVRLTMAGAAGDVEVVASINLPA